MKYLNKMIEQCLVFALLAFGLSTGAMADNGCLSANAAFTSSVGSTTSCGAANMSGCMVGSGGTQCTYTGSACDMKVIVSPAVGASSDNSTNFTVVNPGLGKPLCQPKASISQGNQGANYCVNWYPGGAYSDSVQTLNNKGDATVQHKALEVCTNENFAGEPRISIEKTVARVFDTTSGPAYDCTEGADPLDVIAPVDVVYCYVVQNGGAGTIVDLEITDDNGTPDDDLDDLTIPAGTLAGGASATYESGIVTITGGGARTNTAVVSGTYQGSVCSDCTDTDTATVNIAVACDDSTQSIADVSGSIIHRSNLYGTSRCAPRTASVNSVAVLCDSSCDVKPGCVTNPNGPGCEQLCKPSHNWTYLDESGGCHYAEPGPGKPPLCNEVLGNVGNVYDPSCSAVHNPSILHAGEDGGITTKGSPTVLYYPGTSGGGTSTLSTVYCIVDTSTGDTAADCPSNTTYYYVY